MRILSGGHSFADSDHAFKKVIPGKKTKQNLTFVCEHAHHCTSPSFMMSVLT